MRVHIVSDTDVPLTCVYVCPLQPPKHVPGVSASVGHSLDRSIKRIKVAASSASARVSPRGISRWFIPPLFESLPVRVILDSAR